MRERKTPEEIRSERAFFASQGDDRKPAPYKFLVNSVFHREPGTDTCYFFLGSWHKLKEALDKADESYTVEDLCDPAVMPEPHYEALKGYDFRPGQLEAIASLATNKCGVICSTVGFGKSFIIKLLCKIYPTLNILVVCAAGAVVRELHKAIREELPGEVGLLNMDSDDTAGKRIIVTTTKSMTKVAPERVQLVLADEAHNYGNNTSGNDLLRFCFARKFGFTATPIRNQGDYKYFEAIFGPVLQEVSFQDAKEAGSVTDIAYAMVPVGRKLDYIENGNFPDHIRTKLFYTSNPVRDRVIVNTFRAIKEANPDIQILIMVQSLAHLIKLCEMLPECKWAHGERGSLEKYRKQKALANVFLKKYEQNLKQVSWVKHAFETAEIKYAVATQVWSAGVNLAHLTVLIRADGAVSGIPSIQIPGRLSRLDEGKELAYLIDIQDDFCTQAETRAKKREKEYNKQGWRKVTLTEILQNIRKES